MPPLFRCLLPASCHAPRKHCLLPGFEPCTSQALLASLAGTASTHFVSGYASRASPYHQRIYTAFVGKPPERCIFSDGMAHCLRAKSPWKRDFLFSRDEYTIRGATLIYGSSIHFTGTNIPWTTDVCPYVAEYSAATAFDCALRGPFDELFSACFPAPQALCGFISHLYLRFNGFVI